MLQENIKSFTIHLLLHSAAFVSIFVVSELTNCIDMWLCKIQYMGQLMPAAKSMMVN